MTVDLVTGEIVDEAGDLTAAEARALTDRIRGTLTVAHDLIASAYTGRAWVALGYESWDAYCAGEFTEARMVRLEREQRREIVASMRSVGMSTRAIASGLGVSRETVREDAVAGDKKLSPEQGHRVDVIGQDGKRYTPPLPRPTPAPSAQQRRALTDSFFDAAFDLGKALDRVVRLTEDDRFIRNAQQVAAKHRSDLLKHYESLAGVLALLPETGA
jgi:hypothetical protein